MTGSCQKCDMAGCEDRHHPVSWGLNHTARPRGKPMITTRPASYDWVLMEDAVWYVHITDNSDPPGLELGVGVLAWSRQSGGRLGGRVAETPVWDENMLASAGIALVGPRD
jgi:hypothetical protein